MTREMPKKVMVKIEYDKDDADVNWFVAGECAAELAISPGEVELVGIYHLKEIRSISYKLHSRKVKKNETV